MPSNARRIAIGELRKRYLEKLRTASASVLETSNTVSNLVICLPGFSLWVNQADNSFIRASIEGTKKYPAAVGTMKSLGSFSVLRTLPAG